MGSPLTILTTNTPHHRYFIRKLAAHREVKVYFEKQHRPRLGCYAPTNEFERQRSWAEHRILGDNDPLRVWCFEVRNINEIFNSFETGIVYGTSRILPPLIDRFDTLVNLHGGKLPDYRGLDTNLQAVLDGNEMGVTLHGVDTELDTGPIYDYRPLHGEFNLANLQAHTAILATEMALDFLDNRPEPVPQTGEGKYCGMMSWHRMKKAAKALEHYS